MFFSNHLIFKIFITFFFYFGQQTGNKISSYLAHPACRSDSEELAFFETTRRSEKWPFLETTKFDLFLETSRDLVSSRAVTSWKKTQTILTFSWLTTWSLGTLWKLHIICRQFTWKLQSAVQLYSFLFSVEPCRIVPKLCWDSFRHYEYGGQFDRIYHTLGGRKHYQLQCKKK